MRYDNMSESDASDDDKFNSGYKSDNNESKKPSNESGNNEIINLKTMSLKIINLKSLLKKLKGFLKYPINLLMNFKL